MNRPSDENRELWRAPRAPWRDVGLRGIAACRRVLAAAGRDAR